MIVTFTANPSIDRTASIATPVARGGVNRLGTVTSEPGGKGVNVSRAIHLAGQETVAVLPADDHDPLIAGLREIGVPHRNVPVGQPIRSNLTIVESDGTTTKLNEPGPRIDDEELVALRNSVVAAARSTRGHRADWVALCGSLPPGAAPNSYGHLVELLHQLNVRVAVDTSDAPLKALAEGLPRWAPDLVKPNSEELGQLAGVDGSSFEEQAAQGNWEPVLAAARSLNDRGIREVLVTLGGSGALLVTEEGAWHATPPAITVASTVGAGDSSLAGYLLASLERLAPDERLQRAVAYGTAAASLPGSQIPTPDQAQPGQVTVTRLA
ncbi:1-phosphofructokinase family hexose kinase [Luteococcus sp. Sow4_B9]|uniref:1-phosphofructokinase family hexose kinase n=1 Tax=Luteococcus sp. Sow4_B9 TaxID=3438792 RepID=UPI003F9D713C